MGVRNLEEKLTPAAREALVQLLDEYRDQILVGASENAATVTGDVREVSVHDILAGVSRSQRTADRPMSRFIERALNAYLVIGLLTAVLGLLLVLLPGVRDRLGMSETLPAGVALAGSLIAVGSHVSLRSRVSLARRFPVPGGDRFSLRDLTSTLLVQWQNIELSLRRAASYRFGESVADQPLSKIVDLMVERKVLSPTEATQLQRLLRMRNRVVHEDVGVAQEEELRQAVREAEGLLETIRSLSAMH